MLKRINQISIIVGIRQTNFFALFWDQVKISIAYCLFGLVFL